MSGELPNNKTCYTVINMVAGKGKCALQLTKQLLLSQEKKKEKEKKESVLAQHAHACCCSKVELRQCRSGIHVAQFTALCESYCFAQLILVSCTICLSTPHGGRTAVLFVQVYQIPRQKRWNTHQTYEVQTSREYKRLYIYSIDFNFGFANNYIITCIKSK